jgi:hypothetical protein
MLSAVVFVHLVRSELVDRRRQHSVRRALFEAAFEVGCPALVKIGRQRRGETDAAGQLGLDARRAGRPRTSRE